MILFENNKRCSYEVVEQEDTQEIYKGYADVTQSEEGEW
jgi:hypothetical protein